MNAAFRKYGAALTFFLFPLLALTQEITGIWKGYFVTESGEQYKLEFQVKKNGTITINGISYSYLDTRFYGKATMTGNYSTATKTLKIQELRTVEVRNLGGGGTCLMNYKLSYAKSGREEFLEGSYVGKSEDRQNPENNGVWGDCGGGRVYLRKVTTSDFYVEPFLRQPATTAKPPAAKRTTPARTTPPRNNSTVKKTEPKPKTKPGVIAEAPREETVSPQKKTIEPPATVQRPSFTPPQVTRDRKNELTKALTLENEVVTIRLYDNGQVDNDTISVYLNGKLILASKRLSATPITYELKMEEGVDYTLVMVAENMGGIPPNTSLMIVQDGDRRHQVSITSTEQKNAMVRFRYEKPGK